MTKRDFLLCAGVALCLGGCVCGSPGQNGDIPPCTGKLIRGPDHTPQYVEMEHSPCILRSVSGIPAPLPFPGKEPAR